MKPKYLLPIFISFLFLISCLQIKISDSGLNLDFETVENGIPKGWDILRQQEYSVSLDSVNVKNGKYSIVLESTGDSVIAQPIAFLLPNNYDGEKMTLSGYMKTENITDGYAGLFLMHFPSINMADTIAVTGTTEWKKYEITLSMDPARTQKIVIGGILVGKGKMWLDNLQVTIDGKDIGKVKSYKPIPFSEKAKKDNEFDKGSNVVFPELTKQKIDDLELLGRIWGFLKYHHPAIAKGKYNTDYELFRILPTYMRAKNYQQRDRILVKWINKYGRIPKCETCQPTPDDAFIKPDLSWIEYSNINLKLKNLLHKIYLNRNQGNHYYIEIDPFVGTPMFTNENPYSSMYYPDAGFRLLALYRYWNMIYYFYPYRYLTDKDWNTVLNEYVPQFIEAKGRLGYELTAALLLGEISDTHAFLRGFNELTRLKGSGHAPVFVQFVEDKLVVVEPFYENVDMKKGDVITHIEGKPVEVIVDSMKRFYPASNEAVKMKDIAKDILRTNKHYIHINYIPFGQMEQKEIDVEVENYRNRRVDVLTKSFKFLNKDIGYINLETINEGDIPVIKKEFNTTTGIIIDIRNYPPRDVNIRFGLGSFFVSKNTPFNKRTIGNSNNPGEFSFTPANYISKSEEIYQGKLVVIVNEETFSNAELIAMAFHAGDNTTIIGSTTAGSIGINPNIVLPGGLSTTITGIGTYYPDGRETQRIGIVPDIEVKPTINGIREGRDELLEKAIEIIKQGLK